MHLHIYPSKLYAAILCIVAFGLASLVFLASGNIPLFAQVVAGGVTALIVFGTIRSFVSSRPVLTVDESGLHDTRFGSLVIPWEKIYAYRHAPRVERPHNGKQLFTLFEAWRPIQLWVDAPDKTFFTRLSKLKRSPIHQDFPNALYLEIKFSGLDTPSSKLVEFIREYAPKAKEEES